MTQKYTLILGGKKPSRFMYALALLGFLLAGYGLYHWASGPKIEKSTAPLSQGYKAAYKVSLPLKDGSMITMVPITNSKKDFNDLYTIYTEPSCAAMMTSGKPWSEKSTRNNQMLYAFSWDLFHDLQRTNSPSKDPLTLGFLIFDENGILIGDAGLQTEKEKGRADEVFFNVMPDARRKGIGYETGKHLIQFYEKHFGKKPMGANILPDNIPSQNLMKKLGFKKLFNKDGTVKTSLSGGRTYELWERAPESK
jgi:RimJ/RimL family protein N-acetyltransferase